MAGLLYFFPKVQADDLRIGKRLNPAVLDRYGLAESLGDIRDIDAEGSLMFLVGQGPGGSSGSLVTTIRRGSTPPRVGYFPDAQRWQKVLAEPELWIGCDKEYPPTPEDLERPQTIPGHRVTLADGQNYLVPIVRTGIRGSMLPGDIYLDADGKFQHEVKPLYRSLWDAAGEVWDAFFGEKDSPDMAGMLGHCLQFFGLNYRYGHREHSLLRLIDTVNAIEILKAVVDIPFLMEAREAQKKSDSPEVAVT